MNTEQTNETASARPENDAQEQIATLNCRVRRQPASLGNYHYHVEAGKRVYVICETYPNGRFMVSCVPEKHRCSDDCFTVPASFLTFET